MTHIQLRRARPDHAGRLADLYATAHGKKQVVRTDLQMIGRSIVDPAAVWIVAHDQDRIIGFAHTAPIGTGIAELLTVHVDKTHRGGGIGTALIQETMRLHTNTGVTCLTMLAPRRNRAWLERVGIQIAADGDSIALATPAGAVHLLAPTTGRRPLVGVGFAPAQRRAAIAWTVPGWTPDSAAIGRAFIDTFHARRDELHSVLDDLGAARLLNDLGHHDLMAEWARVSTTPASPRITSIPIDMPPADPAG